MENQKFDINKLRVASPCSVDWETMSGDERSRHCDSCRLNVYNIAGMTSGEVRNLIETREGRLCIRLYKRADGTILTKDCPIGFRAYQKRITRFAGAALATILGLFSVSFGQKEAEKTDVSKVKTSTIENQIREGSLYGTVKDSDGAVVPNAEIKLTKKGESNSRKINSDSEGNYKFDSVSKGLYELEIFSLGFKNYEVEKLKIKNNKKTKLDIVLEPQRDSIIVGIYVADPEPLIDVTSSGVKTTITSEQIEKLPH